MTKTTRCIVLSGILLTGVWVDISKADVFITLDDFESYTNTNPIWATWIDGSSDEHNGSVVGHTEDPYVERSIVYGGSQSMPFYYDNSASYSEATRTFANPQELASAEDGLSLYFRGVSTNSPASMYVALGDTSAHRAVVFYAGPSPAVNTFWTLWNINLQAFTGVDLAHVSTISLGFIAASDDAGQGIMYFDDIRYSTNAAQRYYVDAAGAGDFTSIQAAIDAASDGDEIEVAPGTYYENIDFKGKGIRLCSRDGAEATTIDGGGGGSVVRCVTGENSDTILEGFRITDGWAPNGGGMYNVDSSPSVMNCIFVGNHAEDDGGGMTNRNSSPTVMYCRFANNSAGDGGGGMHNRKRSHPIVTHCSFDNNLADDGGGMQNFLYSSPTIAHCSFTGNLATGSVSGNSSNGGGIDNTYSSSPTITHCTFRSNSAQYGGGMLSGWGSSTMLVNCVFIGNSADYYGGGMYLIDDSSPVVINCTFAENLGQQNGGAIYNHDCDVTIANSIVWGNNPNSIRGSAVVTYSDIEAGWTGTGNIDADPLFVSGNLKLSLTSPCIDIGDNGVVTEQHDLAGNSRVVDGNADGVAVVDMGAYEFQPDPQDVATPVGENASIEPEDASGDTPVTLTFENVVESGFTRLQSSTTPDLDAPATFQFGTPPTYYDITTSATYTGEIALCFSYDPTTFGGRPSQLRLYHYEDDEWVDCTTSVNIENHIICGTVTSLSPFAICEPAIIPVDIAIKPGEGNGPAPINPKSRGTIPVAILGSADLDVAEVDPLTLRLNDMAVRVLPNGRIQCSIEDVNGDGWPDLVCHFVNNPAVWSDGLTSATLTGCLYDGTAIEGTAEIRLVP